MSKRRISLILGLGVILAMGITACGKHLPAESESEAINIQVVTREAAAETMAEEPSAAGTTEEETSAAEEWKWWLRRLMTRKIRRRMRLAAER